MLFKKEKRSIPSYPPEKYEPVSGCSICTGEQVAGFKDLKTGAFEEVMLIRDTADLLAFKERYGIEGDIEKFY